ncbi:MAG: T9SS type A sorting domain-containing protein [Bacteroidota bacterium]
MKKHLLLLLLLFIITFSFSQEVSYQTRPASVNKFQSIDISSLKTEWNVQITNLDNPFEGNKAYAEHIKKIKDEVEKRFPLKDVPVVKDLNTLTIDTPIVISGFEGNPFYNSVPNDNTLAISNGGMLMSAINTSIYFFDTNNDTLLKTISLSAFSDTLGLVTDQYDPKLLYDPNADKFIIVYLAGFLDSTSNIIVGFSQNSDPLGSWNMYSLPGNPLFDTSWSDFPAIAMTEDDLFITVNLLKNNESWQNAFKQSVVWQVDKNEGYCGNPVQTKLWYNILYSGKSMRNLNPIGGGSRLYSPDIFLLSNRNFDIQNDTIFLLHITGDISDTSATITINPVISDKTYGMPPKARQPQNHTFETNDARILGGFYENSKIQFAGNTVDTLTGQASFYHGIISNVTGTPSLHLNIFTDTLDYGYPNISYTGNNTENNSAIITVNHSSSSTPAGFSAFYYDGSGSYSPRISLKKGITYVNLLTGSYERWGDYSGSQCKYNEPGIVWAAGSFGKARQQGPNLWREHGTWIAQLKKPDDEIIIPLIPEFFNLTANPNPVEDVLYITVDIPYDSQIEVELFDVTGKLIKQLMSGQVTAGKNLLTFSTIPLRNGTYFLSIQDSKSIFLTRKIVKGQ